MNFVAMLHGSGDGSVVWSAPFGWIAMKLRSDQAVLFFFINSYLVKATLCHIMTLK